jgi:hypothetical protein
MIDTLIALRNEAREDMRLAEYTHDDERASFYRSMVARITDLIRAEIAEFEVSPPR